MRAFQGTFAVDIWPIKCCVVDIWSIFGLFFWWSIFDKTPVAGLYIVNSKTMPDITVQVYSVAVKSYETNYTFYNSNIKLD